MDTMCALSIMSLSILFVAIASELLSNQDCHAAHGNKRKRLSGHFW